MNDTDTIQAGARTQHTPGPWTTPGEDGGERVICYIKDNGQRGTLAHVYDGKAGTMEANARLIAAAPELLETLRMVTTAIQAYEGKWEPTGYEMNRIHAAIAKAEGR